MRAYRCIDVMSSLVDTLSGRAVDVCASISCTLTLLLALVVLLLAAVNQQSSVSRGTDTSERAAALHDVEDCACDISRTDFRAAPGRSWAVGVAVLGLGSSCLSSSRLCGSLHGSSMYMNV